MFVASLLFGATCVLGQDAFPSNLEAERGIVYAERGRITLKLDIIRNKIPSLKPEPAVVFIHGGAWREGRRDQPNPIQWALADLGFICFSIDYRLSQEEIFPAQVIDCKEAIRWIRENAEKYGVDGTRIGVWGASAGGHLASLVGVSGDVNELAGEGIAPAGIHRVQAVADLFGPIDLIKVIETRRSQESGRADLMGDRAPEHQLLGGNVFDKKLLAQMASPLSYITSDDPPFLILHGMLDDVVPIEQSKMFADALKAANVKATFVQVPGLRHELKFEALKGYVVDFFERELK